MKLFFFNDGEISYEMTDNFSVLPIEKLYVMYRDGIHDTRLNNPIDHDIKLFNFRSSYKHHSETSPAGNNLFHYASRVSCEAIQELFDKSSCVAYQRSSLGRRTPVGFITFYEKEINGNKVVYLSHIATDFNKKGIGTKLIQVIFNLYPAGTNFYLAVRKNNQAGIHCYQNLGFYESPTHLKTFGYDSKYFLGMEYTTTAADIQKLHNDFTTVAPTEVDAPRSRL